MVLSEWIPYLVVAFVEIVGVSFAIEGTQYAVLRYMSWQWHNNPAPVCTSVYYVKSLMP